MPMTYLYLFILAHDNYDKKANKVTHTNQSARSSTNYPLPPPSAHLPARALPSPGAPPVSSTGSPAGRRTPAGRARGTWWPGRAAGGGPRGCWCPGSGGSRCWRARTADRDRSSPGPPPAVGKWSGYGVGVREK